MAHTATACRCRYSILRCSRPSLLPSFALHVKPVTSGEADYRSRHVAALVLIVDPVDRARVDPGLVEAALGLTPAQAGIAVLLARGEGRIVSIASIMGFRANAMFPHIPYQATKGAIVNMTRSLAVEWAGRGIRVNAIAPTLRSPSTAAGSRPGPPPSWRRRA